MTGPSVVCAAHPHGTPKKCAECEVARRSQRQWLAARARRVARLSSVGRDRQGRISGEVQRQVAPVSEIEPERGGPVLGDVVKIRADHRAVNIVLGVGSQFELGSVVVELRRHGAEPTAEGAAS